ncbi:MAG TPA: hypothetical protein VEA18_04100 [Candidatus Kapabacteria bacterium]|nr:hypothetical protein [Candidatus Kapabacteria bacterium]
MDSVRRLTKLTPEKELSNRQEGFQRIASGSRFDIGNLRTFIACKKMDDKVWEVVELNQENRRRIVQGEECIRTTLSFDEMYGLIVPYNQEE